MPSPVLSVHACPGDIPGKHERDGIQKSRHECAARACNAMPAETGGRSSRGRLLTAYAQEFLAAGCFHAGYLFMYPLNGGTCLQTPLG